MDDRTDGMMDGGMIVLFLSLIVWVSVWWSLE